MKYMLLMHKPHGTGEYQVSTWSPEDFEAHMRFMLRLDQELTESGERVGGEALAAPGQAKIVRAGKDGVPAVTDGPFPETKEFLAGFWSLDSAVGHLLRELAPQVLGAVARRHGDFAAADDAVQEALIAAAAQWPAEGIPANPRGWLYHVALRRLTDHLRSELARRRRENTVATALWAEWAFVPPPDADIGTERDDTLALLFMCCHPALTPPSAIALTLRAVGGLTTAEIANAFLVPEATMAQRISRAKQRIKASKVPFSMPMSEERAERLSAVLHVLYFSSTRDIRAASAGTCIARISPTRRSGWPGPCTACSPTRRKSRGCSRSCCSPMRAASRAPERAAS